MRSVKRSLYLLAGLLSLVVGVLGIILPLVPTVPLILLAGFCFARSSERLHNWLTGHRYFGPIIYNFQSGKGIPRRIKYRAIILIWVSMSLSCWLVGRLWACLMLATIGLLVSLYLLRMPDYTDRSKQDPGV